MIDRINTRFGYSAIYPGSADTKLAPMRISLWSIPNLAAPITTAEGGSLDGICGRIALTTPGDELAELFQASVPKQYHPRYNIAPSQRTPVVRTVEDKNRKIVMASAGSRRAGSNLAARLRGRSTRGARQSVRAACSHRP